jgi:signal transduction histidine kinase
VRLVETAHAERRRIERDLHDSVQQHLVGLRIKLDLAVETMHDDPETGERQLASVGRQLDEVLQTLRSLARGIYPNVLHERGLPEAIKSVARSSPMPVRVHATHFGRFPEDIEVAIYFYCLEALQNVAKHGGADVSAIVSLTEGRGEVTLEVRDNGPGFDLEAVRAGSGLVNMRDRIDAVGGRLKISSAPGRGTIVRAIVPMR